MGAMLILIFMAAFIGMLRTMAEDESRRRSAKARNQSDYLDSHGQRRLTSNNKNCTTYRDYDDGFIWLVDKNFNKIEIVGIIPKGRMKEHRAAQESMKKIIAENEAKKQYYNNKI